MLDGLLGRGVFCSKWLAISPFVSSLLLLCMHRLDLDASIFGIFIDCFSAWREFLIKLTRMWIDVIGGRRNATQEFLKKDIGDLIANRIETNAYGSVICRSELFKFVL
ncbi:hypothetical protein Nepgr_005132 [Nepenthes gracilis]|uniref:Uncharacterized protein n=1 Tax=Nepenthes gracilis TaxID=150966 RepID=A0AAD3S2Q5_NEPGR|nr:hypothetical protein Nepgr_005132 [Nepenthes gracilis]